MPTVALNSLRKRPLKDAELSELSIERLHIQTGLTTTNLAGLIKHPSELGYILDNYLQLSDDLLRERLVEAVESNSILVPPYSKAACTEARVSALPLCQKKIGLLNSIIPFDGLDVAFSPWLSAAILQHVGLRQGDRVHVLGSGNGCFLQSCREIVGTSGIVFGYEIVPSRLRQADAILSAFDDAPYKLSICDVVNELPKLPIDDDDVVIATLQMPGVSLKEVADRYGEFSSHNGGSLICCDGPTVVYLNGIINEKFSIETHEPSHSFYGRASEEYEVIRRFITRERLS